MATADTIESIIYDAETLELRIGFADGRLVIHRGVPSAIHAALAASAEQMRFYLANVRDTFPRA